MARRKDMAGDSDPQTLKVSNGRVQVNPGRWDLQLAPSPNYVAVGFSGPKGERPENGRADGWTEVLITGLSNIKWVLSSKPGSIHGVVTGPARDAVPGAPVLLEAYDPDTRKRIHE